MPIEKPAEYNPARFRTGAPLSGKRQGCLGLRDFLGIVKIPNGKADINSTGPVSTDLLGASWEYPEASYQRRKQIWEDHLRWAQGLLYFLRNDASVPQKIRAEARHGDFPKTSSPTRALAHQLYVREGRRMLGEYILTQHDLQDTGKSTTPSAWLATTSISAKCNG